MRKVVVFGNVPLATWVVERILSHSKLDLVGVVCDSYEDDHFRNHGMREKSLHSFCLVNDIKILGFDEAGALADKTSILGISVRYHRLFKKEYYERFKPGIINLHGGELPRYRGANIANYAILESAPRIGGTLHFIAEGIDSGDIVERVIKKVDINKMTAFDFFSKTLEALKEAFTLFLDRNDVQDASLELKATPQTVYEEAGEVNRLYYRKNIEKKRMLNFSDVGEWEELYRLARAYTFPGHEGLVLVNGDEKIELRVVSDDQADS